MFLDKIYNSKKIFYFLIVIAIYISPSSADEETLAVLEKLKKDVSTLEKAVYSQSSDKTINTSTVLSNNDEDVLTRHLLKLSEIEQQFQQLTNKFEEINFKIDKLSSRLSKVQADNQLRFQELEVGNVNNTLTLNSEKSLPGSSQPQDLGSITYKDTETKDLVQKTQSIETTSSVVTENFVAPSSTVFCIEATAVLPLTPSSLIGFTLTEITWPTSAGTMI